MAMGIDWSLGYGRITGGETPRVRTMPIRLGHLTNSEYALLKSNWLSPARLGVAGTGFDDLVFQQNKGLAKKLSKAKSVDKIPAREFNRIISTFSKRMSARSPDFTQGNRELQQYYMQKYPMIREAIDPSYARALEKARRSPGFARRFMNQYWSSPRRGM